MGILLFVVSVAWMEAMGCLLFRRIYSRYGECSCGLECAQLMGLHHWNVNRTGSLSCCVAYAEMSQKRTASLAVLWPDRIRSLEKHIYCNLFIGSGM